jgi:hypothetical protein
VFFFDDTLDPPLVILCVLGRLLRRVVACTFCLQESTLVETQKIVG